MIFMDIHVGGKIPDVGHVLRLTTETGVGCDASMHCSPSLSFASPLPPSFPILLSLRPLLPSAEPSLLSSPFRKSSLLPSVPFSSAILHSTYGLARLVPPCQALTERLSRLGTLLYCPSRLSSTAGSCFRSLLSAVIAVKVARSQY